MILNVLGNLLFSMYVMVKYLLERCGLDLESYPVQVDRTTGDILINVAT